MKTETICIVDTGRGPQLSTSRITVQDLLPYYRDGASNDEIRKWMPLLSDDEIAVLREYIEDHYDEVLQTEQSTKAYHDQLRTVQPTWTRATDQLTIEERRQRLRRILAQRQAEKNGAHDSPG